MGAAAWRARTRALRQSRAASPPGPSPARRSWPHRCARRARKGAAFPRASTRVALLPPPGTRARRHGAGACLSWWCRCCGSAAVARHGACAAAFRGIWWRPRGVPGLRAARPARRQTLRRGQARLAHHACVAPLAPRGPGTSRHRVIPLSGATLPHSPLPCRPTALRSRARLAFRTHFLCTPTRTICALGWPSAGPTAAH